MAAQEKTVSASPAPHAYLVGGGIASMAAAVFMIRDGDMKGCDITILEELDRLGGSLDGAGNARDGYVLRGGRMLESKYLCTFALFDSIPTLDKRWTVTEEIFAWNQTIQTDSKSRLAAQGERMVAPHFELTERHILTIEKLAAEPEAWLGETSIAEQFDADFFKTNFWFMWCTTFAFQPWHSAVEFRRYMLRFSHMVAGFNRLHGIMRTVYNQYDSLVRPLQVWLEERGVRFALNTRVTDLVMREQAGEMSVSRITCETAGLESVIKVTPDDYVLVTLGSMTEASALGSNDAAAPLHGKEDHGAWSLWDKLATHGPQFGHPGVFSNHIDESKWISFTTTFHDKVFLDLVRDFTGNVPGEGGLVTFARSNWLASIVIPVQPHFIGQPDEVSVMWGYGLAVDAIGNYVKKPMSECSGREIMTEIMGHLRIVGDLPPILADCICIPCMMPFITSQFLRRGPGDRPDVVPAGTTHFAVTGQFCEIPDDVVFTVEYSIRSAQMAVYALLGIDMAPPAMYQGKFDPRVLFRAFRALHDVEG
jgi:oleate hydratase